MLQKEFEERTGFRPTSEYYHSVIEPEYNNSNLDKDAWCKQWKKDGGIQKAYDYLLDKSSNALNLEKENKRLQSENKILKKDYEDQSETCNRLLTDLRSRIEENNRLMESLIEISEVYSSAELRKLIIDKIGFKSYITYKLENNKNIWAIDKEDLINHLINE